MLKKNVKKNASFALLLVYFLKKNKTKKTPLPFSTITLVYMMANQCN